MLLDPGNNHGGNFHVADQWTGCVHHLFLDVKSLMMLSVV